MSLSVTQLYEYLNRKIPPALSCEWDNDGLMCCPDPGAAVSGIVFALDANKRSLEAASDFGANVLCTHHPLIFRPLHAVTDPLLISLIDRRICVMSFHTRLDALPGGTADTLAAITGIHTDGNFADGAGRLGELSAAMLPEEYAMSLKKACGAPGVTLYSAGRLCRRIAVLPGSGKDYVDEAISAGADTFITGEAGYHSATAAADMGVNVIELGHYNSELAVCSALAGMVRSEYPDIPQRIFEYNPSLVL